MPFRHVLVAGVLEGGDVGVLVAARDGVLLDHAEGELLGKIVHEDSDLLVLFQWFCGGDRREGRVEVGGDGASEENDEEGGEGKETEDADD